MKQKVTVRRCREEDYPVYERMASSRYYGTGPDALNMIYAVWHQITEEDMRIYTVLEQDSGDICGFVQFGNIGSGCPTVGVDILDGYESRGYATEAVGKALDDMRSGITAGYFRWEVEEYNEASIRVAEKLGAEYRGESESDGYVFKLYIIM